MKAEPLKGKQRYYLDAQPIHHDNDIKSAVEFAMKKVQEFEFPGGYYKGHISLGAVYEILREAFEEVMK